MTNTFDHTSSPVLLTSKISALSVSYRRLIFVVLIAVQCLFHVSANTIQLSDRNYEDSLLEVLETVKQQDLNKALVLSEQHLLEYPKSRIIHLVKADILQAISGDVPSFGLYTSLHTEQLSGLHHQVKNRWQHIEKRQSEATDLVPASIVVMGEHKFVLVADLQFGRLYLYANQDGLPVLVSDYYLSVGSAGYGKQVEGDNKTPVGIYSIIRYIEGIKLPDLYGKGAFPVDYPNRYDRALDRTGYGIWLHGTPSDTYARAPWSSEGCFVLSNDDLLDIQQYIDVPARPPVILSDSIEWISLADLKMRRKQYLGVINDWKRDWENLDMGAYLSHYSRDNFNFGSESFASWAKKKIDVNHSKKFVQVDLDVHSLFVYPGEQDMFVVKYRQRYLSDNFAGNSDKELFWQRDADGKWKIIYEGF
jgi:murein L,D-transpeptidase YafK